MLVFIGKPELNIQELGRAESDYRQLISSSTGDADAHAGLAQTLAAEGKIDAAEEEYGRALGLQPENPKALLGLGGMLLESGENQQAIRLFGEAVSAAPDWKMRMSSWRAPTRKAAIWSVH